MAKKRRADLPEERQEELRERDRARYRNNPERQKKAVRRWIAGNRERHREGVARWRREHPEYFVDWRAAHRDDRRAYNKGWRAKHPDYHRQYMQASRGEGVGPRNRAILALMLGHQLVADAGKRLSESTPIAAAALSTTTRPQPDKDSIP